MSRKQDSRFRTATLLEVYKVAGSTNIEALKAAADKLYPGCLEDGCPIYVVEGGGRAFANAAGEYERPAFTIGGYKMDMVGILADGTAYPY